MIRSRPRPRNFRVKWLVLILAAIGGFYAWRTFYAGAGGAKYPANAFYVVKRSDLLISVTEEGALRALNEVVVRSNLEGLNRIIHLVPEGAHVKKGELLVELDSAGLKDRLDEQELTYQERLFQFLQAQGNLKIQKSLAESQIKQAELTLENAKDDLEKYRDAEAPLLIKTIEARAGVLAEQVRIASERHARTDELFKTQKATRSELEADALTLKREQLALSQYQEDLRLIKKFDQPNQIRLLQSKVDQAREELERLKQRTANEIAQAEADLKTSERTIAFLEESLKTQKQRLENAKIFAPQDGLVVYASVSPFQSMGGGEDRRWDERSGRGFGGRGGDGEFRGGRRGGRSSSGAGGSGSGSSPSGSAQAVSAANQRIASAISGASTAQPGVSGSGGGARGGGSGGGSGTSSASSAFASYPSMRPSSSLPGANGSSGASSAASSSSSFSSGGGSENLTPSAPQFGFRSQSSGFSGYDSYGTPGILEEGIMVRQRQELIRLPDVSKMLAEIKIHESRVRQVRAGMTAYVRVDNIPDRRFKGTVRRVALLPDQQMSWMNPNLKVFPTDILVEDELPDLKPGVSARAEIIVTNLSKVLSVPIHTVARLRGENVCFVQRDSTVVPVPVTTGWYNDRFVEITAGLKEGDRVLLAPASDEQIETPSSTETNQVESAVQEPAPPTRPAVDETPPVEEPLIRRREPEAADGEVQPQRRDEATDGAPQPERRRERPPGQGPRGPRRPRNTESAPE